MANTIRRLLSKIRIRLRHYKKGNQLKVIVTGPPRSGTSFLCGLIVRMGFDPGPKSWLKKGDRNNPYGYYECTPLMTIDHGLLGKFGGNAMSPPYLPKDWIMLCDNEQKQISEIVQNGGIQVYKGNMLVVLADLYARIFPEAKWIFIKRSQDANVNSLVDSSNTEVPSEKMRYIRKRWLRSWQQTQISKNCLSVTYEEFMDNPRGTVKIITEYLEVTLSEEEFSECVKWFKPRSDRTVSTA